MRRGRSTGTPTKAQAARFDAIGDVGCIACRLQGIPYKVECERDHLNVGGLAGMKRIGHDATLGLCCWHHRGEPFQGMSVAGCRERFGPSKQLEKRQFIAKYGSLQSLLNYQNELLEAM